MSVIEILENLYADTNRHDVQHIRKTGIINILIKPLAHLHTIISEILHEIAMEVFQKRIDFCFKSADCILSFNPTSFEILKNQLFFFRY